MPQWYVLLLIPAIGFSAAGFVCAVLRFVGEGENGLPVPRNSFAGIALGFAVSMFAGPYLVAVVAIGRWRDGRLTRTIAAIAPLLAVLWSFCAGVFVIEILMLIGLVAA